MNISVIIPTYNRNDLLSKCLNALGLSDSSNLGCEFIVTDDSPDNIAKPLVENNFPWVRWIKGCGKGPAANRNNGVKNSFGDWLIFLDDDCLPEEGWLTAYINAITKCGSSENVFEGYTDADRPKERFDEEAPINKEGNKLWSCNFAIKKAFFLKLGGFDETFPFAAMEDVDFHQRVLTQSRIVFLSDARVIHPWRRVKPFKNFKKHFQSHRHFANKYNLNGTLSFRISRVKIFLGSIYFDFVRLWKFSMKGWPSYFEKCLLNFYLIFI